MTAVVRSILLGILGIGMLTKPAVAGVEPTYALMAGYSKIVQDGDPGGSFGVLANAFIYPHPGLGLGAEIAYHGYGTHPASIAETEVPGGVILSFEGKNGIAATQATAQALFRGTHGSVRPYATIGGGFYVLKATIKGTIRAEDRWTQFRVWQPLEESRSETELGFNLGAGLQHFPRNHRSGFLIDARIHVIPGAWLNQGLEKSSMTCFALMVGVIFH
jgi:hypothetical protein